MSSMNRTPPADVQTLPQRIRWARDQKGWTQSKLALAAEVSTSTVGMIESGARINKGSLPQLADALGVQFKWLLHGVGDVYQPGPEEIVRKYEDPEERRRRMMGPDYVPGPTAMERNHELRLLAKETEFTEPEYKPSHTEAFKIEVREAMGTWGRFDVGREVGRRKIEVDYMTHQVVAELSVIANKGLPMGFERKVMRLALIKALDADRPRRYLMIVLQDPGTTNNALEQAKLECSILGIDLLTCSSAQEAAWMIKNLEQTDPLV